MKKFELNLHVTDSYFMSQLVKNGFYNNKFNLCQDALRGNPESIQKLGELKNKYKIRTGKKKKEMQKVVKNSVKTYLRYLSDYGISRDAIRKIKILFGEDNRFLGDEFQKELDSRENKRHTEPNPFDYYETAKYNEVDFNEKIDNWRNKEDYENEFDLKSMLN